MFCDQSTVLIVVLAAFSFVMFVACAVLFGIFFRPWIQAYLSGVPLMITELIAMKLRRTDIKAVTRALIVAKQGGVTVSPAAMEKAWVQGVEEVVCHCFARSSGTLFSQRPCFNGLLRPKHDSGTVPLPNRQAAFFGRFRTLPRFHPALLDAAVRSGRLDGVGGVDRAWRLPEMGNLRGSTSCRKNCSI